MGDFALCEVERIVSFDTDGTGKLNLNQLTLDEFLCSTNCIELPADPNAFTSGASAFASLIGPKIRDLGQGYSVHELLSGGSDTAVMHAEELVGYYCGEMLAVRRDHQRKRLAVPLILEAVGGRPPPVKRTVSKEGKAALTRAWLVARGQERNPWP